MATAAVVPTLSPSMDIQVSSNFERLLFEMNGRDGGLTAEQLRQLRATGRMAIEEDQHEQWLAGTFRAARFDDPATLALMRDVHADTGLLVDPHTAVGIGRRPGLAGAGRRHGRARHGASGQVPRRRRAGDRRAPAAPRPPGRSPRPAGADARPLPNEPAAIAALLAERDRGARDNRLVARDGWPWLR